VDTPARPRSRAAWEPALNPSEGAEEAEGEEGPEKESGAGKKCTWQGPARFVILGVMETLLPITVDPEVLSGTPVFRGTRVPAQTLVDYILDGETLETFLRNFPTVKREDAVRLLQQVNESLLAGVQR